MNPTRLDQIPYLWRAESLRDTQQAAISSGDPALDRALGGGWPSPALIEMLCDHTGIGELQLLIPLLRQRCALDGNAAPVLWLNPPHPIQAVALTQYGLDAARHWLCESLSPHDTVWAMEQALRAAACALVIAWSERCSMTILRRLKLAAITGRGIGVLFRPTQAARTPSPATVRLQLKPHSTHVHIDVLKVQGRKRSAVQVNVERRLEHWDNKHAASDPSA